MSKKLQHVLLIDDDDDDNFFHRLVLEDAAVAEHVHIVQSGTDALRLLVTERFRPELIFLDINMPKINGWEFLEKFLKANGDFEPVIILLTTSLNPADKKKADELLKKGSFATKPLTKEKVQQVVFEYFPAVAIAQ